jgi:hypothetical protein
MRERRVILGNDAVILLNVTLPGGEVLWESMPEVRNIDTYVARGSTANRNIQCLDCDKMNFLTVDLQNGV